MIPTGYEPPISDALYLAAVDHAFSEEEIEMRNVLLFHRDFLNGGFAQAIHNTFLHSDINWAMAGILGAYRAFSLYDHERIVADAFSTCSVNHPINYEILADNATLKQLDDAYVELTYQSPTSDSLEEKLLERIRNEPQKFASVMTAAQENQ